MVLLIFRNGRWKYKQQTKKQKKPRIRCGFSLPFRFQGWKRGSLSLINKTSCEISNSYYSVYRYMVVGVHECDGFSAFTDAL